VGLADGMLPVSRGSPFGKREVQGRQASVGSGAFLSIPLTARLVSFEETNIRSCSVGWDRRTVGNRVSYACRVGRFAAI
jgi:hypothetical protein